MFQDMPHIRKMLLVEVRDDLIINLNFQDAFQACKQCAASATYTTISLARVAISVLDANTVHCILQPQE